VGDSGTPGLSVGVLRKPEGIEVAFGAIAVALLVVGGTAVSLRGDLVLDHVVLLAAFLVAVICVLAGGFLSRRRHQSAALALHFAATLLAAVVIRGLGRTTDILLLVLLQMHIALRLPVAWAAACHGLTLVVFTTVTMGIHGSAFDRVEVLIIGAVSAILAETVIVYRERLVHMSNRVAAQHQSLENLAAANQSFVAHLESVGAEAAERERLMITRELHDCVGYAMTNITMMMNASSYLHRKDPDKLLEYCEKTKALASTTLQETRQILYRLRSVASQGTPNLPLYLTRLCRDFEQATGVRTECNLGNLPSTVSEAVFNTLFRTVQVGFINAVRHGNTGHIVVSFWLTDECLRMSIWNDVPADVTLTEATDEGIGLRGIRERLDNVGGTMAYGQIAHGYQLTVSIPCEGEIDATD
jgi:signal transduction histidine kinase